MRCKHGHEVITIETGFRRHVCCGCTAKSCRAQYQPLHDMELLGYKGLSAAMNLQNNGWSSEAAQ